MMMMIIITIILTPLTVFKVTLINGTIGISLLTPTVFFTYIDNNDVNNNDNDDDNDNKDNDDNNVIIIMMIMMIII